MVDVPVPDRDLVGVTVESPDLVDVRDEVVVFVEVDETVDVILFRDVRDEDDEALELLVFREDTVPEDVCVKGRVPLLEDDSEAVDELDFDVVEL